MARIVGPGARKLSLDEATSDSPYQSAVTLAWQNIRAPGIPAAPFGSYAGPFLLALWSVRVYARTDAGAEVLAAELAISQRAERRVVATLRCPGARSWSVHVRRPAALDGYEGVSGELSVAQRTALEADVWLASSDAAGPAVELPSARHRTIVATAAEPAQIGEGVICVGWIATSPDVGDTVTVTGEGQNLVYAIPQDGSVGSTAAFQGFPLRGPLSWAVTGNAEARIEVLSL